MEMFDGGYAPSRNPGPSAKLQAEETAKDESLIGLLLAKGIACYPNQDTFPEGKSWQFIRMFPDTQDSRRKTIKDMIQSASQQLILLAEQNGCNAVIIEQESISRTRESWSDDYSSYLLRASLYRLTDRGDSS